MNIEFIITIVTLIAGFFAIIKFLFDLKKELYDVRKEFYDFRDENRKEHNELKLQIMELSGRYDVLENRQTNTEKQNEVTNSHITQVEIENKTTIKELIQSFVDTINKKPLL